MVGLQRLQLSDQHVVLDVGYLRPVEHVIEMIVMVDLIAQLADAAHDAGVGGRHLTPFNRYLPGASGAHATGSLR